MLRSFAVSDSPQKDAATVSTSGVSLTPLPHGVSFHRSTTHVDERGSVCEIFDARWNWHADPVTFVYTFTLRPGMGKGWGLHKRHEDRYFLISGEILLALYDARDDSPTKGLVSKIFLTEHDRRIVNIPAGVWHANWNIGTREAVVVNLPTRPYQHDDPDKYRLPIDTGQIPFAFERGRGR